MNENPAKPIVETLKDLLKMAEADVVDLTCQSHFTQKRLNNERKKQSTLQHLIDLLEAEQPK